MDTSDLKFDGLANIKKSTKLVYITKFKKIINDVFQGVRPDPKYIDTPECFKKVSEYIKSEKVVLTAKKPTYNAWIRCLEELKISTKLYDADYKNVSREADEELTYREPTEKEEDEKITFKELEKCQKKWAKMLKKDTTNENDIYYMICSLYLYLEPLRTQDYINTRLLTNCQKFDLTEIPNYVCMKCSHLVIREFKTDKIHEERKIDISKKLINIIKRYHKKTDHKYLVSSANGLQLLQPNFWRMSKEACGVSTNLMRKIYVSEKLNDKLATNKDKKKAAKVMGHKPSTQAATYAALSVLNSDKDDLDTLKQKRDLLVKLIMETESAINKKT
jgi:hypothetical protein